MFSVRPSVRPSVPTFQNLGNKAKRKQCSLLARLRFGRVDHWWHLSCRVCFSTSLEYCKVFSHSKSSLFVLFRIDLSKFPSKQGVQMKVSWTRQVSSMIHSARPTVSPVPNIVFAWNLLCFARFFKRKVLRYEQHMRKQCSLPGGRDCGSAEWIKKCQSQTEKLFITKVQKRNIVSPYQQDLVIIKKYQWIQSWYHSKKKEYHFSKNL